MAYNEGYSMIKPEYNEIDAAMQLAHDNGYNEGYHDGYADGQDDCSDRMRKRNEKVM